MFLKILKSLEIRIKIEDCGKLFRVGNIEKVYKKSSSRDRIIWKFGDKKKPLKDWLENKKKAFYIWEM